jgi:LacI family transcriptional regulator
MRDAPHVSPATRERVQRAAKKVGYRLNPVMSRLMNLVRSGKRKHVRAAIGVVRDDFSTDFLRDRTYHFVDIGDIRTRARHYGYSVEEFWVGPDGLSPARLTTVLRARGIEGIIVSPQSSRDYNSQLDFTGVASATFGYAMRQPAINRSATNMMQGILECVARLRTRGYRRIGLAVPRWIDFRVNHYYSGAMYHCHQDTPPRQRIPPLFLPDNPAHGQTIFCAWVKRHRPDVLISIDTHVPDWITRTLKLKIPEDIGFVVHDWTPRAQGYAGMDHRRPHLATAAVDLVATQLMHNEFGVPAVPRQVLIPPAWVEGGSI